MSFYIAIYSNDKYVRSLFRNHSLALIKNCRFRDSDCTLTIYCHLAQTAFTREGVILFQFEYEFLEFWYWNLVPFLPDRFPAVTNTKFCIFCLIMCQKFSIGERSGLQAG